MKRREMVEKLSDWLLKNVPETYSGLDKILRDADAKNLLSFIEESGMAPPKLVTFRIGDLIIKSEHKWELDEIFKITNDVF